MKQLFRTHACHELAFDAARTRSLSQPIAKTAPWTQLAFDLITSCPLPAIAHEQVARGTRLGARLRLCVAARAVGACGTGLTLLRILLVLSSANFTYFVRVRVCVRARMYIYIYVYALALQGILPVLSSSNLTNKVRPWLAGFTWHADSGVR